MNFNPVTTLIFRSRNDQVTNQCILSERAHAKVTKSMYKFSSVSRHVGTSSSIHVPDDSIQADNQTDGRVSRSSSSVSTDHWLADPRDTSQ